jgi:hypothetical protein
LLKDVNTYVKYFIFNQVFLFGQLNFHIHKDSSVFLFSINLDNTIKKSLNKNTKYKTKNMEKVAAQAREIRKLKREICLLKTQRLWNFKTPKINQRRYGACGYDQKRVINKKLKSSILSFNENNEYLRKYLLKISKIEFVNTELFTQLQYEIKTDDQGDDLFTEKQIEDYVYFKDRFNISDSIWEILRNNFDIKFPSLYKINKKKRELEAGFTIVEIADKGFYIEPSEWIKFHIDKLFEKDSTKFLNKNISIKIELDGFNIARQSNVLNFSFAILNEGKIAATASGTYNIGFFKIEKECYEELQPIVSEIWQKIKVIQTYTFNDQDYKIVYFNCCDHKMQAIVSGNFYFILIKKC